MKLVIIIAGEEYLKRYFHKFPDNKSDKKKVFYKNCSLESLKILQENGFKKILLPTPDENGQKKFIEEYNELIATVTRDNPNRLWWATDIASKNRFTSQLPFILQEFIEIKEILQQNDFDRLIIINLSESLLEVLKKTLHDLNICFIVSGNSPRRWLRIKCSIIKKNGALFYNAFKILRNLFYAQKKLHKIWRARISRDKQYYVIKTFVYNHSFTPEGEYKDVFFGCLPEFLKEKTDVLIFAYILGDYRFCIEKIARINDPIIFPFELLLSWRDVVKAVIQIWGYHIRVAENISFFSSNVASIIHHELEKNFKGIQIYQFLHYESTKKLVELVRVKFFLMTYENNPWERMCTIAIKENNPSAKIIGYQHTVVPQAALNVLIGLKERETAPLPDRILTVGEIPKKILEKYGNYKTGDVETACALRFESLSEGSLCFRQNSRRILVALEGVPGVQPMVDYVIRQLANDHRYEVMIRTHPVLPWNYFEKKFGYEISRIPNFKISHGSTLTDDLNWAGLVIYWGSTVVLEALKMGKPAIHFNIGSVLSFDPLFECHFLKWIITPEDSLSKVLESVDQLPDDQWSIQQLAAQNYIDRYFYPILKENLRKFLVV